MWSTDILVRPNFCLPYIGGGVGGTNIETTDKSSTGNGKIPSL